MRVGDTGVIVSINTSGYISLEGIENIQFVSEYFEIVEDNPMPELEPGMVLVTNGNNTYIVISNKTCIGANGTAYSLGKRHENISAIYTWNEETLDLANTLTGDLIWQKETPEQKQLRELKELHRETGNKIKELEESING